MTPDDGFPSFTLSSTALCECLMDAGFGANVSGDTLVVVRIEAQEDRSLVATPIQTLELDAEPVHYDITGYSHTREGERPEVGCSLTYYDDQGVVRMAHLYTSSYDNAGVPNGFRVREFICPEVEGDASIPHHVFGAYDADWNVYVGLIGYTDDPVRFYGTRSEVRRWRVPIAGTLQTFGSIPEDSSSGTLDLVHGADHANVYPTGVVRHSRNTFLLTVADVGESVPAHLGGGGQGDAVTKLIRASGYGLGPSATVQGVVGRGFVEEIDGEVQGYLPHATHESNATSVVTLLHYPSLSEVDVEVGVITGNANWRPIGLFAERLREPDVLDPLFFDPLGSDWLSFLLALLTGTTPIPVGGVLSDKVLCSASIPDQPFDSDNPRSFPSFLMVVDLQAQITPEERGPAVLGDKLQVGYGDVLRIASHPEGVSWAVLGRWDLDAEAPEGADETAHVQP